MLKQQLWNCKSDIIISRQLSVKPQFLQELLVKNVVWLSMSDGISTAGISVVKPA